MTNYSGTEEQTDRLLRQLIEDGILQIDLHDEDIELLLANAHPIQLSPDFAERALAAMSDAQRKRVAALPTAALGELLTSARVSQNLNVDEVADRIQISSGELGVFEKGILSIPAFMNRFPPGVTIRLIKKLGIRLDDFTEKLMEMVTKMSNERSLNAVARTNHRSSAVSHVIEQVSEYIDELERLDKME